MDGSTGRRVERLGPPLPCFCRHQARRKLLTGYNSSIGNSLPDCNEELQTEVSALMESKRLEKANEALRRKREEKQRKAALAQASALPRLEADKSIERHVQAMLEPLREQISNLQEQVSGNRDAPRDADADGAAEKSAKKSRKKNRKAKQNAVEKEKEDAPKRKRQKLLKDSVRAPARPKAASGDLVKRPGSKLGDKLGKRRRLGAEGRGQD